ncbi:MAG: sulfotransferase [Pseudomonadales bacterium]|nr:sulfotransferase [Pseudomonadales bacterium]
MKEPIIFIGPGRSGSTIVSEFVFVHEHLAWLTQYHEWFPNRQIFNHFRNVFDNRLWQVHGERSQLNKTKLLNELIPRPAEAYPFWEYLTGHHRDFSRDFMLNQRATPDEKRFIRQQIAKIVVAQGRQRFAMKITGPGRIAYLKSLFPDAQFINVVRSAHETITSMINVPFWQQQGMKNLWWTGAYDENEIAAFMLRKSDPYWVTAMQLAKVLETTQQETEEECVPALTIAYEDFIENAENVVNNIMQFTGLPECKNVDDKLLLCQVVNRNKHKQRPCHAQKKILNTLFNDEFLGGLCDGR